MSRIGKNPVPVPAGVEVSVSGQEVKAKGKLGELSFMANAAVEVKFENGEVSVSPRDDSRDAREGGNLLCQLPTKATCGRGSGFLEHRLKISSARLESVGCDFREAHTLLL